jgi:hypothetical protein
MGKQKRPIWKAQMGPPRKQKKNGSNVPAGFKQPMVSNPLSLPE